VFNPKFLIHSHSHVAMLGWLFLALAGLISQFGMKENGRRQMGHPLYLILLHLSIAGMTDCVRPAGLRLLFHPALYPVHHPVALVCLHLHQK
jgi:hypothetical protein